MTNYDPLVVETPWYIAILGLPIWLLLPILLLVIVTRSREVRVVFGVCLALALTFLYLVVADLVQGRGLPNWIEASLLWGPTTLVMCGAAFLADRWFSQRKAELASVARDRSAVIGGRWLTAAFVAWSLLLGCCVSSFMAESLDLRLASPTAGLVLPMPSDLTLISAERSCGTQMCSDIYLIGSPDGASVQEVTDRLWDHLVASKNWDRMRADAGCQSPGWFVRHEFCVFVDVERSTPDAVLKVHVSGAVVPY